MIAEHNLQGPRNHCVLEIAVKSVTVVTTYFVEQLGGEDFSGCCFKMAKMK